MDKYIGEGYTEKDIHAKFENGELMISLPTEAKKEESLQSISIE